MNGRQLFLIIISILSLNITSCGHKQDLQTLGENAQTQLFSNTQTVPQLNLKFKLPNNWDTDNVETSLGVQQTQVPYPSSARSR